MSGFSMSLRALMNGVVAVDDQDVAVRGLASSSADVRPGSLFLACAGQRSHGLDHLDAALKAGAVAVAWEPMADRAAPVLPAGIPAIAVAGLGRQLGVLGDRFFGQPSKALAVTGITGTNGKTTVAWLVAQALEAAGKSAAYSGTLGYGVPPALTPSALTTPACIEMHRRLGEFAKAGMAHVIAEVSSHALDQGRVDAVHFAVAALTNFSRDHLDYHADLDHYAAAKARLFFEFGAGKAVINVGDRFGRELAGRLPSHVDAITVALMEPGAAAPAVRLLGRLTGLHRAGLGLALSGDFGEAELQSPLWGRFNAENLVVAAGILIAHGLELDEAVRVLSLAAAPPGRMQAVTAGSGKPVVLVDFAHTPDALAKALDAARAHAKGSLWCVFGCGGERDQGKRANMGEVAVQLADHIVVTDDNPRNEDPEEIVAQILAGTGDVASVEVIRDRSAAISHAIQAAGEQDTVLIAGKGHETVQYVGRLALPFSDVDAARAALDGVA